MDRWWGGEGFGTIREGQGAKERDGRRGNGMRNGSSGGGGARGMDRWEERGKEEINKEVGMKKFAWPESRPRFFARCNSLRTVSGTNFR